MLSNYTIKKMIPRLIVAAILVNVSFYLAALAVDLSNLLGYNLVKIFSSIDIGTDGISAFSKTWNGVLAVVIAGGASVALLVAIIAAPTALIAFGLILLILIARKALIVLLIVIAPVAFVAYLLPNTEDWFKRWYKMFIALLMVFPITSVVFGASKLASDILLEVAQRDGPDGDVQNMLFIVALATTAIPLFAVPTLLIGALKAIGSIGGKIDAYGNKSLNKATGSAKQRAGDLKKDVGSRFRIAANNSDSRLQNGRIGKLGGKQAARFTRWNTRRGKLREDRSSAANRAEAVSYSEALGEKDEKGNYSDRARKLQAAAAGGSAVADEAAITRAAAQATKVGFKQFDEDVEAYKTTLTSMSNERLVEILKNNEGSKEYQAAVAGTIMGRNHRQSHINALRIMGERAQAADASGDTQAKEVITDVQKQMAHDMRDKPWALGDQATGQLQNGTYGYATSHTGDPQEQFGNIDAEMKKRVLTKLSAQSLADMNPDEMRAIYQMANGTHASGLTLNAEEMANLDQKIADVKTSRYKDDIKPEAQEWFSGIQGLQQQRKQQQDKAFDTYVKAGNVQEGTSAQSPSPTTTSHQGQGSENTEGDLNIPRN